MAEVERCEQCGAVLALVGLRHNCVPRSLGTRGPKKGRGGRPRRGEEDKTLAATKPWAAEGISESTWYRRKKQPREMA
jgi:hypothetical protein